MPSVMKKSGQQLLNKTSLAAVLLVNRFSRTDLPV
jgi:hypothetical protein